LCLEFEDGSSFTGTIQMYGGLYVYPSGTAVTNKYYLVARERPSPLSAGFDQGYFEKLFDDNSVKLSLKAFLATGQRIPGLGNGVLQDILFHSGMHPKKKVSSISVKDKKDLLASIKTILKEMVARGGRDTERDLFGNLGGYVTILSKNTAGKPCPVCGKPIVKEAYLGGSIYYCKVCQRT
jgi:formamidopyrimidine-DNA glycosylase